MHGSSGGGGSSTAAIHQPTAEELRLEQRRKDVQKWLTEGSYSSQQEALYMGMSRYDYSRIAALEYILLDHKNDPYVADNIRNEIAAIKGTEQANVPKTTRISYADYVEYDKSAIVGMHQSDTIL